jgi:glycosyltransferase 2 family protein
MGRFWRAFLRWGILGTAGAFITKTLCDNWAEVSTLQMRPQAWVYLSLAMAIAIMTQLWSAVLWGWILALLKHPVPKRWAIITFLRNAPAKYIPGSVWHLYGRVMAARERGIGLELATMSVMLEPLFLVAGALGLALWHRSTSGPLILALSMILLAVHPRVLNRIWRQWCQWRGKTVTGIALKEYPLSVLLGTFAFMGLRSITFLCVVGAFTSLHWGTFQPLMSNFGFAWLLSLVVPAPGGVGVFEASAVQVLDTYLSPGILLGAVTVYRLVNICAEMLGAGFAHLVRSEPLPLATHSSLTRS